MLADALGFGLRKTRVNDKIQFTVAFQRVNVLFLKENPNALRFQRAYIFQTLYRVSGEAGDGFCDDIVDLSVLAVADHALKFRAFVRPCAGDALIGIKAGKLPLFPGGDHFCINAHLVLIGCKLFFGVCGDAAVGRHSLLVIFLLVYKDGLLRFNRVTVRFGIFCTSIRFILAFINLGLCLCMQNDAASRGKGDGVQSGWKSRRC